MCFFILKRRWCIWKQTGTGGAIVILVGNFLRKKGIIMNYGEFGGQYVPQKLKKNIDYFNLL